LLLTDQQGSSSSARQHAPPHSGGSAHSRGGAFQPYIRGQTSFSEQNVRAIGHSRHPSSSRYASGRSSAQAPSGTSVPIVALCLRPVPEQRALTFMCGFEFAGYRNQADYYGPYHRRNQGTGQSAAGGGSGHYYAGSQVRNGPHVLLLLHQPSAVVRID